MSTATDGQLLTFRDWTFRYRPADRPSGRTLLLLHGLTGDENSMWIFTRRIPAGFSILAPRAIFPAPQGGYSWREIASGPWELPSFDDLRPAAEMLVSFVDSWAASTGRDMKQFHLMGFSQGAALSYSLALLYPQRVPALAALSGFLPSGAETLLASRLLAEKPVFIAHGRRDEMVPVERARRAAALLEESGARVTYCEAGIGHKVSKDCMQALGDFFLSLD